MKNLQESILKRNPNSIVSLVRAATVSDSQTLKEKRLLQSQIESLQDELNNIREQQERRLRALRQEYDRMKAHYESTLQELNQQVKNKSNTPTSAIKSPLLNMSPTDPAEADDNTVIDTLPKALNRIKDLENLVERVRAFYTKKVEEAQKKAETQIRAIKRGQPLATATGVNEPISPVPPADNSSTTSNAASHSQVNSSNMAGGLVKDSVPTHEFKVMQEKMLSEIERLNQEYSSKINNLQSDLLQSNNEVIQLKMKVASQVFQTQSLPPLPPASDHASHSAMISDGFAEIEKRYQIESDLKLQSLKQQYEELLFQEKKHCQLELEKQAFQLKQPSSSFSTVDKDLLINQLKAETERANSFHSELLRLQSQIASNPISSHIQVRHFSRDRGLL